LLLIASSQFLFLVSFFSLHLQLVEQQQLAEQQQLGRQQELVRALPLLVMEQA
jgi:hypothetical protein